jgi:hypothetical protein
VPGEFFSAPQFVPPAVGPASAAKQPGSPGREDLGKQFVGGLETLGTRETTVIEAGAIGNDTPIMVSREYWYSPRLGVNLVSKLQDPRIGTQDFQVQDISVGEPDRKLFAVPSRSKVIDLRKIPSAPASDSSK